MLGPSQIDASMESIFSSANLFLSHFSLFFRLSIYLLFKFYTILYISTSLHLSLLFCPNQTQACSHKQQYGFYYAEYSSSEQQWR